MAWIKSSFFKISGEIDGVVYKTRNGKTYVCKKARPGSKKYEPALQEQYSRTILLNELAAEINNLMRDHNAFIKSRDFYSNIQSRFRKEPQNKRLFLLNQLKGMEINPLHKLTRLNTPPTVTVKSAKDIITVELLSQYHPANAKGNCYFFEVMLFLWDDSGAPCELMSRRTSWINADGALQDFDIPFPKPAGATDYLVAIRETIGLDGREYNELETQGAMIAETGSFNKAAQRLLINRRAELLEEKLNNSEKENIVGFKDSPVEPKSSRPRSDEGYYSPIDPAN